MFEQIKDLIVPPIKEHRIFFFHVAKCGGTSIANAIVNCYKPWRYSSQKSVVTLNEDAARFAEENSIGEGIYFRSDLLNYMMATPNLQCISGHFSYSNIAYNLYHDQWHFITILRNPIDRWLSHYNYNTRKGASEKHKITIPLEEFVETKDAETYGRLFVYEVTEDLGEDISIEEKCKVALERYRHFSLIGTINNSTKFAKDFEKKFDHKLNIKHLNITPKTRKKEPNKIPEALLKRITELCEPDLYIYKNLFVDV